MIPVLDLTHVAPHDEPCEARFGVCPDLDCCSIELDGRIVLRLTQDQCAALLNTLADNERCFDDAFDTESGGDDDAAETTDHRP